MAKEPLPNVLLQRERMRHFLTQSELAEIIGVSTKTVHRWELGVSMPRAYYMRKLCEHFGKTPEELGFSDSAQTEVEDAIIAEQAPTPASTSGRALQRLLLYLLVAGVVAITLIVAWITLRPVW